MDHFVVISVAEEDGSLLILRDGIRFFADQRQPRAECDDASDWNASQRLQSHCTSLREPTHYDAFSWYSFRHFLFHDVLDDPHAFHEALFVVHEVLAEVGEIEPARHGHPLVDRDRSIRRRWKDISHPRHLQLCTDGRPSMATVSQSVQPDDAGGVCFPRLHHHRFRIRHGCTRARLLPLRHASATPLDSATPSQRRSHAQTFCSASRQVAVDAHRCFVKPSIRSSWRMQTPSDGNGGGIFSDGNTTIRAMHGKTRPAWT
mmetsp:Transcript_6671/g.23552  ORF Transcript_6671/g.23552 Transcript_6671/m.23552 type:complete len:260 (+) Transcript_6671:1468-2247(+)